MANTARGTGTRATAAAAALAVVAGVVLSAPAPANAIPARTCGPVTATPAALPEPEELEGVELADAPAPANSSATIDMDGDDLADDVVVDEQPGGTTITVTRADGVLTLTDVLPDPPYAGYPAQHGNSVRGDDLDGDGRDELVRTRWNIPGFRQPLRYETTIVRGTTAPGTASVDDIALHFTGELVGDIDGDGLDDLELTTRFLDLFLPPRMVPADQALSGPSLTTIAPTARFVGALVDLDLDGQFDRVVNGSKDRSASAGLDLSMGGSLALEVAQAPAWAQVFRSDTRTFISYGGTASIFEVSATCAQPWLQDAAPLLLGRAPTAAEKVGFGTADHPDLFQRANRSNTYIRSQSGRGHLVDESFSWFLGRPVDPVGRAWWVRQLRAGTRTPERMMNELLGSPERWRSAGSTSAAWVDATYALIMGRTPDPSGRAYWIRQVDKVGARRAAVRLFDSPEAKRFLVRRYASKPTAFGAVIPAQARAELESTIRYGGLDSMLLVLASSPQHYLAANTRHVTS